MASFNKIILIGNLSKDIDVRTMPSDNKAIARGSLAVNDSYGDKKNAMFVDFVAFGKTAEVMGEYLSKGSPIMIEGRLSQNTWQDDNGNNRSKHEVIVQSMQMLGQKGDNAKDAPKQSSRQPKRDVIEDDDIPF